MNPTHINQSKGRGRPSRANINDSPTRWWSLAFAIFTYLTFVNLFMAVYLKDQVLISSIEVETIWSDELRLNRYPLNFLRQAQFWTARPLGWPGPQSVKAASFVLGFQTGLLERFQVAGIFHMSDFGKVSWRKTAVLLDFVQMRGERGGS